MNYPTLGGCLKMSEQISYHEIKQSINELSESNPYSSILKNSLIGIEIFEKEKQKKEESFIRIHSQLDSGIIEADILGKMIQGLQSTIEGAFNYVLGNGSNQGKVPERFSESSKLVVTAFSPGSFVISINSKQEAQNSKQTSLLDAPSTEFKKLVDNVLIDINNLDDQDEITEFVSKYGTRTFNRSKQWINSLKNNEFEYKTFKDNNEIRFEESKIKSISSIMSRVTTFEETESVQINGKLTMINNKTSKLSFEVDDNEITVRVQDDSIEKLNLLTNQNYNLNIKKVTTKLSSGRETVEYLLKTLYGTSLEITLE